MEGWTTIKIHHADYCLLPFAIANDRVNQVHVQKEKLCYGIDRQNILMNSTKSAGTNEKYLENIQI